MGEDGGIHDLGSRNAPSSSLSMPGGESGRSNKWSIEWCGGLGKRVVETSRKVKKGKVERNAKETRNIIQKYMSFM